jgi:transformation/transcription domain-associated protein
MKKQGLVATPGGNTPGQAAAGTTGSTPTTSATTPDVKTEGATSTSETPIASTTDGDTEMQDVNGTTGGNEDESTEKPATTPAQDIKIENTDTNMAPQTSPTIEQASPAPQTPQGSPPAPGTSPLVNMSPAGQQSPASVTSATPGQTPSTPTTQDGVKSEAGHGAAQATAAAASAVAAAAAAANGGKPITTPPATASTTPKHPWELVDEIMSMLKTGYPLLALSMETMVDQIQLKLKPQADEDMYRLIVALLNDGIQV